MFNSDPSSLDVLKCHWRTCRHCGLILPVKTHQRHENSCQDQKSLQDSIFSSLGGCIASGVLYATIVAVKGRDLLEKYKRKQKPVVLMHPSTMMLLKFRNGGPVLLHGIESESVHQSWACAAMEVGCIAFPDNDSFKWKPGDKASLHHLNKFSDIAVKLHLSPKNGEEYMYSRKFKDALLHELDHVFTRVGATVCVHYLGAPCEFSVVEILGGLESISQKNKLISRLSSKDLKSDDRLNQITETFSDLTLKDKSCGGTIGTLNCFMHHRPSLENAVMPTEAAYESGDANNQCKVNDYFMISSVSKVFIENSAESKTEQKLTFDCIGGLKDQLHIIKVIMDDLMSQHYVENYEHLYTGVLLSGPSGTGKTLVASAIANEYEDCGIAFMTINQHELSNSQCEMNIAKVKEKFKEAVRNSPSVLFIDDIDQICPRESSQATTSYQNKRLTAEVADMIDDVVENPHCAVLVLAATNNPENISSQIMKLRRIDQEVRFDVPDLDARHEILKKFLLNAKHNLTEEQVKCVAKTTEQHTGADLFSVYKKALGYAATRYLENPSEAILSEQILTFNDLIAALKEVKPSVSKELVFNIPKVQWNDIAGMKDIKEEIKTHFDLIFSHADAWRSIGMTPAHGFLMYGPPGCAKTMIAMAVANEIKANFIPIKGPELLNKYVGESEKAVRKLFLTARRAAPCIIYFDEIDSIAMQRRSHDVSSKVDERVLSQLLVEMSGIDALEGVIVVASTNRPHMIDSALLRSGRFDRKIYIPLPDSLTRREILEMQLKGIPQNVDLQNLTERTEGYSCAEIIALCNKAIQVSFVGEISSAETPAFMALFQELLDCSPPRTSRNLLDIYEKFSSSNK